MVSQISFSLITLPTDILYEILSPLPVKYSALMKRICTEIVISDEHIHRMLMRHFSLQTAEDTPTIEQLKAKYLFCEKIRKGVYATRSECTNLVVSSPHKTPLITSKYRAGCITIFEKNKEPIHFSTLKLGFVLIYTLNKKYIALSMEDLSLMIWDYRENKCEAVFENAHDDCCSGLILYDRFLFSKSVKVLKIWDLFAKSCCVTIPLPCCNSFQLRNELLEFDSPWQANTYFDFSAEDSEILRELVTLLNTDPAQAIERFDRMPLRIINAVNRELEADTTVYTNSNEKLASAIRRYLTNAEAKLVQ